MMERGLKALCGVTLMAAVVLAGGCRDNTQESTEIKFVNVEQVLKDSGLLAQEAGLMGSDMTALTFILIS
ncbi:hypothetical protein NG99_02690 [Erwinia typographi]|uniref:Uncharacterized protein n=1 Tax=Erwinia typographi TaxID=371042 RepID=A0A0A3Z963_9GAMM|nr:hypothetical protein [Erwinia typographi]KGT95602.1 hypothetical protein NG99_02690 [Erwinia typographi]